MNDFLEGDRISELYEQLEGKISSCDLKGIKEEDLVGKLEGFRIRLTKDDGLGIYGSNVSSSHMNSENGVHVNFERDSSSYVTNSFRIFLNFELGEPSTVERGMSYSIAFWHSKLFGRDSSWSFGSWAEALRFLVEIRNTKPFLSFQGAQSPQHAGELIYLFGDGTNSPLQKYKTVGGIEISQQKDASWEVRLGLPTPSLLNSLSRLDSAILLKGCQFDTVVEAVDFALKSQRLFERGRYLDENQDEHAITEGVASRSFAELMVCGSNALDFENYDDWAPF